MVAGGGEWEEGRAGEGDQKLRSSSYKINNSEDVMYNMTIIVNVTAWYI